jgi:hypothetical protein
VKTLASPLSSLGVKVPPKMRAEGRQRGLDLEHLLAAQHAAVHAVAAHDLGTGGAASKSAWLEKKCRMPRSRRSYSMPVRVTSSFSDSCVAAELHQLLHVALEGRVGALRQEGQAPAPLVGVQPRAEQQRRVVAQQPLGHLEGRAGIGPGLAEADRDLRAVGEAGLQRRVGLAVDDDDFMPLVEQIPGGGDADDAGAENDDLHGCPLMFLEGLQEEL